MAGEVHTRTYSFAFSLRKQSDIFTGVSNAQINKMRPFRSFAPVSMEKDSISDKEWFGKGHPFATFYDTVTKRYVLPSREYSATELEILWAAAFCMGKVVTTGAGPEYTHTITFEDLTTLTETRYTSIIEKMGGIYQKKLGGVWVNSFSLHGKMDDHLMISWEGGGREYEDSVASLPASVTTATFFKTLFGTMQFGPFSNLSSTICGKVLDWKVDVTQAAEPKYHLCNPTDEENLISKVLRGKLSASAEVKIEIDATIRENFLAQDLCSLVITCNSEDIISGGSNPHTLTIEIAACKISKEDFSEDGETVAYTLTMEDESIIKSGTLEPIKLILRTGISGADILVNG